MNLMSLAFANRIKANLRDGLISSRDRFYFVTGRLDVGATFATIEVAVMPAFAGVLDWPPRVWCREAWMRLEEDWHNDAKGGMCWVLEKEWRDLLCGEDRKEIDLIPVASDWLLHNVSSLIARHYAGHLLGVKRWPTEWAAWAHRTKGVEQYDRERRKGA